MHAITYSRRACSESDINVMTPKDPELKTYVADHMNNKHGADPPICTTRIFGYLAVNNSWAEHVHVVPFFTLFLFVIFSS